MNCGDNGLSTPLVNDACVGDHPDAAVTPDVL